jgi:hypothetical protein
MKFRETDDEYLVELSFRRKDLMKEHGSGSWCFFRYGHFPWSGAKCVKLLLQHLFALHYREIYGILSLLWEVITLNNFCAVYRRWRLEYEINYGGINR